MQLHFKSEVLFFLDSNNKNSNISILYNKLLPLSGFHLSARNFTLDQWLHQFQAAVCKMQKCVMHKVKCWKVMHSGG